MAINIFISMQHKQPLQIRWADLDPNIHVRHSVYYDWGAFCRINYFHKQGITTDTLREMNIGPVLLREECVFRKEIKLGDSVDIDLFLAKATNDFTRWTIRHTIRKNEGVVAAVLTVDGTWIDMNQRKITVPPKELQQLFASMAQDAAFEWI